MLKPEIVKHPKGTSQKRRPTGYEPNGEYTGKPDATIWPWTSVSSWTADCFLFLFAANPIFVKYLMGPRLHISGHVYVLFLKLPGFKQTVSIRKYLMKDVFHGKQASKSQAILTYSTWTDYPLTFLNLFGKSSCPSRWTSWCICSHIASNCLWYLSCIHAWISG